MAKQSLELEITRIMAEYDRQAKATMSELNSRGMLYSSFTISERIKNTNSLLNSELVFLAKDYNSKQDQIKISACIDKIFDKEKSSLQKFCEQMPNIKCQDSDFSDLMTTKQHINNIISLQRRKRLKDTATLVVAALTLLVSLVSVVQGFIPKAQEAVIEKRSENNDQ